MELRLKFNEVSVDPAAVEAGAEAKVRTPAAKSKGVISETIFLIIENCNPFLSSQKITLRRGLNFWVL
jgi:hypothetical protein